ncbi:DUF397 domain-containing protein [Streptomyces sp. AJS327]|uniref:DUF397 domain-containing protein n=1 Tax=Streptomyces sp. AJS327 TaxID=2545265 RepID=UPI0015DE49A2|nr:DUF397 domain-containing protein [Streptomyces sp. AJS327]MBA0053017.1 DUF397 domain-containing protein [Streptomyces sp. AJS327]
MSHVVDASALSVNWWKSSRSDSAAQCVECGIVDAGAQLVAVRDSKQPNGPALLLSYHTMSSFIVALNSGGTTGRFVN